MMDRLINFALFQAGWFACVLSAAAGRPWIGVLAVLVAVAVHLGQARRPYPEVRLIGASIIIGLVVDSTLVALGLVSYPTGSYPLGLSALAPYWIVCMWALFATTLNVSLRWLTGRWPLAMVLGAVGGPLSYLAGARLGAMNLLQPTPALAALALAWGLVMPLLALLASRLDGYASNAQPGYIIDDWKTDHA